MAGMPSFLTDLNYFSLLCLTWALLAVSARIAIGCLGPRWKKWELEKAYPEKRRPWVFAAAAVGLLVFILTWWQVAVSPLKHTWLAGLLTTLPLIKLSAIVFFYSNFRRYVKWILGDARVFSRITAGLIFFSLALLLLAFYYAAQKP